MPSLPLVAILSLFHFTHILHCLHYLPLLHKNPEDRRWGNPACTQHNPMLRQKAVFLLVPAYPGCPGTKAVKWLLLLFILHISVHFFIITRSIFLLILCFCLPVGGRHTMHSALAVHLCVSVIRWCSGCIIGMP